MAKSTFDIEVQLTRAALLRLMRGETVGSRSSPPGATMIEGVAKVALHAEITQAETRQIVDALTRDVPDAYRAGFVITSWSEVQPVAGSTEWLAIIASNADRILIKVQNGPRPEDWVTVPLANAPADAQKEAVRMWLASGTMPTWNKAPVQGELQQRWKTIAPGVATIDPVGAVGLKERLDTASGDDLDVIALAVGLTRQDTSAGVIPFEESDGELRKRIRTVLESRKDIESYAERLARTYAEEQVDADAAERKRLTELMSTAAPRSTTMTAEYKLRIIRWVQEQCVKIGNRWYLSQQERDFLSSVESRISLVGTVTTAQEQWLNDIFTKAKNKAASVASLLPALPPP